ncbi:ABC transporter ATP-binding protein [Pararhizobium sp.]|uniref:ABC transporter ATP-binding protein n=1 Tax=Pararhizobium sp. TaxID=1977563 RepID=UPI00271EE257|nr:sn-glycerol-3-phosphate ABC transporter ATP-binding protein UgpC [Pararhizobium sp.]MDO9417089.1 sn-glycerol-3-phosphate ABC transporter ATP-binding protein UgpC [Pararhizobium sp.]
MANVSIKEVVKAYGSLEVLHSVDVDVRDGEFMILVGPSGCGKSTLLRMIAGLETITDGEIEIGGRVVNDLPPKARDIAMVFQSYALYPHMTVKQNMAFSLKLAKKSTAEIDEMIGHAAGILDLSHLLDRYPRQLSGGQRQRVAMGRSIVRNPAVFLFDEPLSNLDAKLRVQMRGEIKALHQRLKSTMVYVTHDQMEAMTMADRIVVMRAGYIEQIGTPLELYDKPVNSFIATFIGSPSMNLIDGVLARQDGSIVLEAKGNTTWPLPAGISTPAGTAVQVGIRPEHLRLDKDGVEAEAIIIEPTGAETHVLMDVGGQKLTGVFRERLDIGAGGKLRIAPDLDRAHLFDKETGRRLIQ